MLLASSCVTTANQSSSKTSCRTFFVFPPKHFDQEASRYMVKLWQGKMAESLESCDRFVDIDEVMGILALIDRDGGGIFSQGTFKEPQLQLLRDRLKATHLSALSYEKKGQSLHIKSSGFLIADTELKKAPEFDTNFSFTLPLRNPLQASSNSRLLIQSATMMPNAFLMGVSSNNITNKRVADGELFEQSHDRNKAIPPIVNGLSLTSLQHPAAFDPWDVGIRLLPALDFLYFDDQYEYHEAKDEMPGSTTVAEVKEYNIWFFGLAPTYNLEATLYSPMGSFFAGVGAGAAGYVYSDSLNENFYGVSGVLRGYAGYRAFISDRFFFQTMGEYLKPFPRYIDNALFVSDNSIYGFVGVGYFLPESKQMLLAPFR